MDTYTFEPADLIDLRRFCGYPMYGAEANSSSPYFGTHFFERAGTFEYRVSHLTDAEGEIVLTFLEQLRGLEAAVLDSTKTLGVESAAVFKRNPAELRERTGIYENWRARLCAVIGVDAGPYLGRSGGTRSVALTL